MSQSHLFSPLSLAFWCGVERPLARKGLHGVGRRDVGYRTLHDPYILPFLRRCLQRYPLIVALAVSSGLSIVVAFLLGGCFRFQ
jgi:hypothetical protein